VLAADTVEVQFDRDSHWKHESVLADPFPTWLLLRAWEVGMFNRIGPRIGGGCSEWQETSHHLRFVRDHARWTLIGIETHVSPPLQLCG
jgi:hypothetical protein